MSFDILPRDTSTSETFSQRILLKDQAEKGGHVRMEVFVFGREQPLCFSCQCLSYVVCPFGQKPCPDIVAHTACVGWRGSAPTDDVLCGSFSFVRFRRKFVGFHTSHFLSGP